jgi:hypothetical protein
LAAQPGLPRHELARKLKNHQPVRLHLQMAGFSFGDIACMFNPRKKEKMNILKLAIDFVRLLNETLGVEKIAQVNALNATEPNVDVCHSHDFCDPNQVMIDAMALQGADFDAPNNQQADEINQAWWLAKKAKLDVSMLALSTQGYPEVVPVADASTLFGMSLAF